MSTTEFTELSAEEMRIAAAGVVPLPIEQSAVWEAFESSQGRPLWGRFGWVEDGRVIAVVVFYQNSLRGSRCLWAKHGPIWLKEATPDREAALREDLRALVRSRDPQVVFVRLHATYAAPDLEDLLQAITYDRTVIIDTSGGSEETILESMTTDGKRAIRRAKKKMEQGGAHILEETGLSREAFAEYYSVLTVTAERDGFRPHPLGVYWDMLSSLGPDHARLFGVRVGGELVCWDLVLVNDRQAVAYYGASSRSARDVLGPDALDFGVAAILAGEGVQGFDLMGAHSPRVPELYHVGRYKKRWAKSFTDVPGAWDMPVRTTTYSMLATALRVKRSLVRARQSAARAAARRAGE